MRKSILLIIAIVLLGNACTTTQPAVTTSSFTTSGAIPSEIVVIAFGSCNKHNVENVFWDDILDLQPAAFIWGGDNIYADTEDMEKMERMYQQQKDIPAYAALENKVLITGTWDDHDYGSNDGGVEFPKKKESQQLFLDFMQVSTNDPRRTREGVYSTQLLSQPEGKVKIINLDTRYFRTPLTDSAEENRRYQPNTYGEGTILGETQWQWLEDELGNSKADFNLVVSSIQLVSNAHGFEKWANHPHEVERMKEVIAKSGAKGVIVLSGDRHISEFSKLQIDALAYPLIDFTSSGLTHSYSSYSGEPNPFRVGEVISSTSFGVVELNLKTKQATFKMMGDNGRVYQQLKQAY